MSRKTCVGRTIATWCARQTVVMHMVSYGEAFCDGVRGSEHVGMAEGSLLTSVVVCVTTISRTREVAQRRGRVEGLGYNGRPRSARG